MAKQLDDLPYRSIRRAARALNQTMRWHVEEHERRCHLPQPRRDPIEAVPFPDMRLSDQELAAIVEMMEREACTPEEAARWAGVPITVLQRELPNYLARHRQWCRGWNVP